MACYSSGVLTDCVRAIFPARVQGVIFQSGQKVDRSNAFVEEPGGRARRATDGERYFGPYGATRVDVRGLVCKNKIVGT